MQKLKGRLVPVRQLWHDKENTYICAGNARMWNAAGWGAVLSECPDGAGRSME